MKVDQIEQSYASKGSRGHFTLKSQFPGAGVGLQAKHLNKLLNSVVELLHGGVAGAELQNQEQSSAKHALYCPKKYIYF
jgi:hypothetical protein